MRKIPSLWISDLEDCFDMGQMKKRCLKILLLKQGSEDRRDLSVSTA